MSSNISNIRAAHHRAAESKRHNMEMKKLKLENNRKYRSEVEKNEKMMKILNQSYETRYSSLENDLKRKLAKLQASQKDAITAENTRLEAELHDLKKAHEDQVGELRISHKNEIERLNEGHRESLKNMEEKYRNTKVKYEY